jgi:hypothetical protein
MSSKSTDTKWQDRDRAMRRGMPAVHYAVRGRSQRANPITSRVRCWRLRMREEFKKSALQKQKELPSWI